MTLDFWPEERIRFEKQIFTPELLLEMQDYGISFDGEPNFEEFTIKYYDMLDCIEVLKPKFYGIVCSDENKVVRIAMKDVYIAGSKLLVE